VLFSKSQKHTQERKAKARKPAGKQSLGW